MSKHKIVVEKEEGLRLDKWLSTNFSDGTFSRNKIKAIIDARKLKVNGQIKVSANYLVESGDVIEFEELVFDTKLESQDIKLDIVYEDNDIIVINKPNEMVVHPGAGNRSNTLVNALLFHYEGLKNVGDSERPGLVHRIDKNTTGLLLIAKNEESLLFLQNEMNERRIKRKYMAIVDGILKEKNGTVRAPIGRSKNNRLKMAVTSAGKPAVTHFKVLKRWKHHTLVECELETGRTHQIRVHMQFIGHPITGDFVYGNKKRADEFGQFLHAFEISFTHPKTKKEMKFTKEYPIEFKYKIKDFDNSEALKYEAN